MTDEQKTTDLGITIKTGFGAHLKAVRESLRLSEKDVATRLHLSHKIIEIIEAENFEQGPPATFIRGYIRSYARLLNLSEHDINNALTQIDLSNLPNNSPVMMKAPPVRVASKMERFLRLSSVFIVLGLASLVIIWWLSHPSFNLDEARKSLAANVISDPVQPPTEVTQPNIDKPLTQSLATAEDVTAAINSLKTKPEISALHKADQDNDDESASASASSSDNNHPTNHAAASNEINDDSIYDD